MNGAIVTTCRESVGPVNKNLRPRCVRVRAATAVA
jgi:hypothetical protein